MPEALLVPLLAFAAFGAGATALSMLVEALSDFSPADKGVARSRGGSVVCYFEDGGSRNRPEPSARPT